MPTCLDDRRDTTDPTTDSGTDPTVVPPLPPSGWAAEVHAALHSDWVLERAALARNRRLPAWALGRLAADPVAMVRKAAFANRTFGPEALAVALRLHPGRDASDDLVRHPRIAEVDPHTLREVLTPTVIDLVRYPAHTLPDELFVRLAGPDFATEVHLALARNHLTPDAVIGMLARAERPRHIRLRALAHPRCPLRTSLRALRDPDVQVRRTVVESYWRRGNKVFELAIHDTEAVVRAEAVRRADRLTRTMLAKVAADPAREVRAALLGRTIPDETMDALLRDEDVTIRRVAAGRPTTVEGQRLAATDPDALVRRRLSASSSAKQSTLTLLLHDDDVVVRRNIARNQAATRHEHLQALANDPDRVVRRNVARHRLVDRELLLRLAADPDETVRAHASRSLLVRL